MSQLFNLCHTKHRYLAQSTALEVQNIANLHRQNYTPRVLESFHAASSSQDMVTSHARHISSTSRGDKWSAQPVAQARTLTDNGVNMYASMHRYSQNQQEQSFLHHLMGAWGQMLRKGLLRP